MVGPMALGLAYDRWHSYELAGIVFGAAGLAAACVFLCRRTDAAAAGRAGRRLRRAGEGDGGQSVGDGRAMTGRSNGISRLFSFLSRDADRSPPLAAVVFTHLEVIRGLPKVILSRTIDSREIGRWIFAAVLGISATLDLTLSAMIYTGRWWSSPAAVCVR